MRACTQADAELDETIAKQQAVLKALTQDPEAAKLAYITHDDLRSLECFESKTVIAIKAPDGPYCRQPCVATLLVLTAITHTYSSRYEPRGA